MKTLPISSIIVPEGRHRQTFNETRLRELSESIQTEGLFHAIVLRSDGDYFVLVAGERRLRAIRDLYDLGGGFTYDSEQVPAGEVPYVLLGDLDPLARELAELSENIKRENLSWQEQASALARIAKLRGDQASVAEEPPPTPATLAEEFLPPLRSGFEGGPAQTEAVRQQLILAKHLDDPEIAGAKTVSEAFKTLKRKESRKRNERMAAEVGATLSQTSHSVVNQESLSWLREQPAGKFSVILTDPPYGMGADEFGDSGGATPGAHGYTDDAETVTDILLRYPEELFRVAAPEAHLYWFCDIDWFKLAKGAFEAVGWRVFRTPLVWFKPAAFRAPWPEHGPQRKYELILYAVKGDRKTQKLAGDVLQFPPDSNLGHAAQKPVALFQELLSRSARPGDEVLDPFCGSGPIFPAAHELKLKATGVELDPANYGIALQRVRELK